MIVTWRGGSHRARAGWRGRFARTLCWREMDSNFRFRS